MTLADVLPSIGNSLRHKLDATLWPPSAEVGADGEVRIGGVPASWIAARYGSPVYVLDEAEVRARARLLRATLPDVEIAYAGKALLCKGVLRWLAEEGLSLDTCSAGELAVARAVGLPGERILVHGNAKTAADLKAATNYPGTRIVLDSLDEIGQLAVLAGNAEPQQVLVRVTPGIDPHTHHKISTGTDDCKFGFSLRSGAAAAAVENVLAHRNLALAGLHCHLGSQVSTVDTYEAAVRFMVGLLADLRERFGVTLSTVDIGGGFCVPYTAGEPEFDLPGFADRVAVALHYECGRFRLPVPRLVVEPGRWLVARAGVTLYRVVSVKHGRRTFVAVDGGMSDNPRPTLYGARYTAQLVGRSSTARSATATVVGRHCESGDVLCEDIALPGDVHAGDLLAVPCTGAYHHPLASNYNHTGRPPIVAVRDGHQWALVRRETENDLLARDLG